jgi:hypothetical protein
MAEVYRASLTVLGDKAHVVEFEAKSMKALKGAIYRWTFEDLEGENVEQLNQWFIDNDIKRRVKWQGKK